MNRAKGSRELRKLVNVRKSRPRKRKNVVNPKIVKQESESFSASAKKMKSQEDLFVPEDYSIEYRIINFITVFSTIATFVKCKDCGGAVKFQTSATRGLGFKILIVCDKCDDRVIPSCSYAGHTYEINKRFIFVMRLLGLGLAGARKFCGLMDMPKFFHQSTYDIVVRNIHDSVITVSDMIFKKAIAEEKKEVSEKSDGVRSTELTVSGDGTWKKRGFTSLFGVSSIIGYRTGKVLDIVVKSLFCKMCEAWRDKIDTAEYMQWYGDHESVCSVNHAGSSGKMEVDGIVEMFKRSEEKYGVKYVNYIGDGDSKTFTGILNASPYDEISVTKKECIGHIQKRMGRRLRECVKKNKGLGGGNKLTGKMTDKLTVYYGLAIRRNADSVENMKKAIWATFDHYSSTDDDPHHENCPPGDKSWCSWQRASANGELVSYQHDYTALPVNVLDAIKPIYTELSNETLLERCKGGFTQNSNESYNQLIWKISPKILPSGSIVVNIAAHVAACMFNEGCASLLTMLQAMGVSCGRNCHAYVTEEDEKRVDTAERRAQSNTREARLSRRQHQIGILEAATSTEGLLYGPGIDDSI